MKMLIRVSAVLLPLVLSAPATAAQPAPTFTDAFGPGMVLPHDVPLEFTGRVGELELQGIDLITLDDRFAIAKLDVLMRPIDAIAALREIVAPQMTAYLARRQ